MSRPLPHLAPASALVAALRRRDLSAVELLQATLARVDRLNGDLNAVVARDDAAALVAAGECDRRYAAGTARPLEGLPISIKDAFDVAGMVSTAGAPAYKDRVPEADAAAVAALRASGAVIFGKSNVPPYSGDFQTSNPVYGTTNNPFDLARSPGGSSGGAAAAVAAGLSAFELGSDLGGSIRWPAHCCGLFGLKPTWGLVSTFGHVPPPPEMRLKAQTDLVVAGPLARSASDLALLLPVLAGAGRAQAPALRPARRTSAARLRVALWLDDPFMPVDASVRDGVIAAAVALEQSGAEIDETARPDFAFEEAFEVFALLQHALIAAGLPSKVRDRLVALAAELDPADRSHRALQARAAKLDVDSYSRLQDRRLTLKRAWADFFTRYDVLLCPPAPVTAIPHDAEPDMHARYIDVNGEKRPYFDIMGWAALATASHLPAAIAPVPRRPGALPSGVQIIAAEHEDLTAIAVAVLLERELGGFKGPSLPG